MQAPPTPHHNPFASVTPAPTPGPSQMTQLTQMSPLPMMTNMQQKNMQVKDTIVVSRNNQNNKLQGKKMLNKDQ
jgi:hypothetical protein